MGQGLIDIVDTERKVADREAEFAELRHRRSFASGPRLAELAPAVGEEAQRPRRGNRGILLAKRARRGVARIRENLSARRLLPLVKAAKSAFAI